jgi:hypothetical protein
LKEDVGGEKEGEYKILAVILFGQTKTLAAMG